MTATHSATHRPGQASSDAREPHAEAGPVVVVHVAKESLAHRQRVVSREDMHHLKVPPAAFDVRADGRRPSTEIWPSLVDREVEVGRRGSLSSEGGSPRLSGTVSPATDSDGSLDFELDALRPAVGGSVLPGGVRGDEDSDREDSVRRDSQGEASVVFDDLADSGDEGDGSDDEGDSGDGAPRSRMTLKPAPERGILRTQGREASTPKQVHWDDEGTAEAVAPVSSRAGDRSEIMVDRKHTSQPGPAPVAKADPALQALVAQGIAPIEARARVFVDDALGPRSWLERLGRRKSVDSAALEKVFTRLAGMPESVFGGEVIAVNAVLMELISRCGLKKAGGRDLQTFLDTLDKVAPTGPARGRQRLMVCVFDTLNAVLGRENMSLHHRTLLANAIGKAWKAWGMEGSAQYQRFVLVQTRPLVIQPPSAWARLRAWLGGEPVYPAVCAEAVAGVVKGASSTGDGAGVSAAFSALATTVLAPVRAAKRRSLAPLPPDWSGKAVDRVIAQALQAASPSHRPAVLASVARDFIVAKAPGSGLLKDEENWAKSISQHITSLRAAKATPADLRAFIAAIGAGCKKLPPRLFTAMAVGVVEGLRARAHGEAPSPAASAAELEEAVRLMRVAASRADEARQASAFLGVALAGLYKDDARIEGIRDLFGSEPMPSALRGATSPMSSGNSLAGRAPVLPELVSRMPLADPSTHAQTVGKVFGVDGAIAILHNWSRVSAQSELEKPCEQALRPLQTQVDGGPRRLQGDAFRRMLHMLFEHAPGLQGPRENLRPFAAGLVALLRSAGGHGLGDEEWRLFQTELEAARARGDVSPSMLRSMALQFARSGNLPREQALEVVRWIFDAAPGPEGFATGGHSRAAPGSEADDWSAALGRVIGELSRAQGDSAAGELPPEVLARLKGSTMVLRGPALAFAMDAWVGALTHHVKEIPSSRRAEVRDLEGRFERHLVDLLRVVQRFNPDELDVATLGMLIGFQNQFLCDTEGTRPAEDLQHVPRQVLAVGPDPSAPDDAAVGWRNHCGTAASAAQSAAQRAHRKDACATQGTSVPGFSKVEVNERLDYLKELTLCFDRRRFDGHRAVESPRPGESKSADSKAVAAMG